MLLKFERIKQLEDFYNVIFPNFSLYFLGVSLGPTYVFGNRS